MMSKTTKHIVAERIALVAEMLIDGKDRRSILQFNSEEGWCLSERQIDTYIARARQFILSEITRDVEYDYAKAMKRFERLYQKAITSKDYKLALAVNKEVCNLQGLYSIQVNHSGSIQFICNLPE